MPRRRRSLRLDLMEARLEIELAAADAEQAQRIQEQLRELASLRRQFRRPIPARRLMKNATYCELVGIWHRLLLAGTCKWLDLMKVHQALRRMEVVAGIEEDQ